LISNKKIIKNEQFQNLIDIFDHNNEGGMEKWKNK